MSEDIIIIIVTNTALLVLQMMYLIYLCILKAVSVLWLASIMDWTVVQNINICININILLLDIPVK